MKMLAVTLAVIYGLIVTNVFAYSPTSYSNGRALAVVAAAALALAPTAVNGIPLEAVLVDLAERGLELDNEDISAIQTGHMQKRNIFKKIGNGIKKAFNKVKDGFKAVGDKITGAIGNKIKDKVKEEIKEETQEKIGEAKAKVNETVTNVQGNIQNATDSVQENVQNATASVQNGVQQGQANVQDAFNGTEDAAGQQTAGNGTLDNVRNAVSNVADRIDASAKRDVPAEANLSSRSPSPRRGGFGGRRLGGAPRNGRRPASKQQQQQQESVPPQSSENATAPVEVPAPAPPAKTSEAANLKPRQLRRPIRPLRNGSPLNQRLGGAKERLRKAQQQQQQQQNLAPAPMQQASPVKQAPPAADPSVENANTIEEAVVVAGEAAPAPAEGAPPEPTQSVAADAGVVPRSPQATQAVGLGVEQIRADDDDDDEKMANWIEEQMIGDMDTDVDIGLNAADPAVDAALPAVVARQLADDDDKKMADWLEDQMIRDMAFDDGVDAEMGFADVEGEVVAQV